VLCRGNFLLGTLLLFAIARRKVRLLLQFGGTGYIKPAFTTRENAGRQIRKKLKVGEEHANLL
jgi:hypothetical protein